MRIFDFLFKKKQPSSSTPAAEFIRSTGSDTTQNSNMITELEKMTRQASFEAQKTNLPAMLRYPYDPLSAKMFEPDMMEVRNTEFGYQFKLYDGNKNPVPDIQRNSTETCCVYYTSPNSAFVTVSTMVNPNVPTSSIANWLEPLLMMGFYETDLHLPSQWSDTTFKLLDSRRLGSSPDFSRLHNLDESVFYLLHFTIADKKYTRFIMLARKNIHAWKVTATLHSLPDASSEQLVPALVFGSFFPIDEVVS